MLKKIGDFLQENQYKIYSAIGILALIGLAIYLIWRSISFIGSLPGFTFDPLLALLIIFLTYIFRDIIARQNEILKQQYQLLNKLVSDTKPTLPKPRKKRK